jgi:hypothetical protein
MRKKKAGLTAFFAKHGFTLAIYAWWITPRSAANLGREILRFLIPPCASRKQMRRVMSELVGCEAHCGAVRWRPLDWVTPWVFSATLHVMSPISFSNI